MFRKAADHPVHHARGHQLKLALTPSDCCRLFRARSGRSRIPVTQWVAGPADGRFRATSAEVVSFGGPNMKFLALVEYAILTVASSTAYSQTVPAGRAQLIVSVDL